MVIFEGIPLGFICEFTQRGGIHNDFVRVQLRLKPVTVLVAHLQRLLLQYLCALVVDARNEVRRVRRVPNALEELDALLSLEFLQIAILFDKFLFFLRQFHIFQICQHSARAVLRSRQDTHHICCLFG